MIGVEDMKKTTFVFDLYKDLISSIIIIIISIFSLIFSFQVKESAISAVSGRLVPQIFSVILFLLGFILLVKSLFKIKGDNEKVEVKEYTGNIKKVLATLLSLALYAFLMPVLGFIISTTLYLIAQMIILGDKKDIKIIKVIIISVISSVVINIIFVKGFLVMLPSGIFI